MSGQGRERFARTAQGGFDVIAHPRHRLAPVIVGVPVEIVDPCALGVALRVEAEDQRGEYQRIAAAAFRTVGGMDAVPMQGVRQRLAQLLGGGRREQAHHQVIGLSAHIGGGLAVQQGLAEVSEQRAGTVCHELGADRQDLLALKWG